MIVSNFMKTHKKKLIFIELNEVNLDIVKKYGAKFNFKFFNNFFFERLKKTFSEKEYHLLEPWIQWVSIYTGKKAYQHKIFRLGDIVKFKEETIFDQIDKNYSVGAICPMNITNNLKSSGYFIPDPWTNTESDNNFWSKKIHSTISFFVKNNANKSFSILIFSSFKVTPKTDDRLSMQR